VSPSKPLSLYLTAEFNVPKEELESTLSTYHTESSASFSAKLTSEFASSNSSVETLVSKELKISVYLFCKLITELHNFIGSVLSSRLIISVIISKSIPEDIK